MTGSVRLRDIVLPSPANHTIISRPMADSSSAESSWGAYQELLTCTAALLPMKSDQSLGVCAGGRGRRGLGKELKVSKSRLLLPSVKMLTWIWTDEMLWNANTAWGRGEGQKCTMAGDHDVHRGWLQAGRAPVHTQGFCIILLVSALDAPVRHGESHCPSTSEDFFFQSLPIAFGVAYSYCNIKKEFKIAWNLYKL